MTTRASLRATRRTSRRMVSDTGSSSVFSPNCCARSAIAAHARRRRRAGEERGAAVAARRAGNNNCRRQAEGMRDGDGDATRLRACLTFGMRALRCWKRPFDGGACAPFLLPRVSHRDTREDDISGSYSVRFGSRRCCQPGHRSRLRTRRAICFSWAGDAAALRACVNPVGQDESRAAPERPCSFSASSAMSAAEGATDEPTGAPLRRYPPLRLALFHLFPASLLRMD